MKAETIKLGIIERLMRVKEASTLKKMERLISQAELESRTEDSLKAIKKGEVVTLDEFSKENLKWVKKNSIK